MGLNEQSYLNPSDPDDPHDGATTPRTASKVAAALEINYLGTQFPKQIKFFGQEVEMSSRA